MGWFRAKAIEMEEKAKKAAQESLDTVSKMDEGEKGVMWTYIAIAIVITVIVMAIVLW
jgi:hypothetical protein